MADRGSIQSLLAGFSVGRDGSKVAGRMTRLQDGRIYAKSERGPKPCKVDVMQAMMKFHQVDW